MAPPVDKRGPTLEAKPEDQRRSATSDVCSSKSQGVSGSKIVVSIQCGKGGADPSFPEDGDDGGVVVTVGIAEDRQRLTDVLSEVIARRGDFRRGLARRDSSQEGMIPGV